PIAAQLNNHPGVKAALSDSVRNMMSSVKILTGKKGPDLTFHASVRTQTDTATRNVIIETGDLDACFSDTLATSLKGGSTDQDPPLFLCPPTNVQPGPFFSIKYTIM
ncbi:MAG: hypothetical protein U9N77_17410, partial [Thermodesulfobacteriota bacterium]|nr:hypothetical protein [Thermodesulfobacteriota bacterium]